jgi:cell division protein FtsI/penicillin-binding protein 2
LSSVFEPGFDYGQSSLPPRLTTINEASDIVNQSTAGSFAGHTIKDVHPNDSIALHDVCWRSSNIGMTKSYETWCGKSLRSSKGFGFGQPSGLKFSGESPEFCGRFNFKN